MSLEITTYINGLDVTNPTATDPKSQGDDHIRLLKSTLKATFPNVAGAVSASHTELSLMAGVTGTVANTAFVNTAISQSPWGFRNRLVNGNFAINQRGVSGTVTLAAGAYGHDRFKAGAGGCTYTFAASLNGMVLTITAGTLQQVIEGANLEGGTFKLSWFGTATGRVDAGAYGASGVVGTAVAGTNQTVEFGAGTLARVQYEIGSVVSIFEQRSIAAELLMCQRYFQQYPSLIISGYATAGVTIFVDYICVTPMRAAPIVSYGAQSSSNMGSLSIAGGITKFRLQGSIAATGSGYIDTANVQLNAEL